LRLQTAATDEITRFIASDGIDAFAHRARVNAGYESFGVLIRIGVRHARHFGRDIDVVGEMGNCVDIGRVGRAQQTSRSETAMAFVTPAARAASRLESRFDFGFPLIVGFA
jgi:hypothetical protein